MSTNRELTSPPLSPNRARELVLELERSGLETNRIHVDAAPPTTTIATSRADRRAMTRPVVRVAAGVVAGVVLGLLVALAAIAIFGSPTGPTLLAVTIGAAIIGGLTALYARLPMNTELFDVDSGQVSRVRVDISDLSQSDVASIDRMIGAL